MTLFNEQDPFPDTLYIYKCKNCDDIAEYIDREGALYQCQRHQHKSHDCKTEHMAVGVYRLVENITDVDKAYFEGLKDK